MLKADINDSNGILLNSDLKHVKNMELSKKYIDCIFNKEVIVENPNDNITLLFPKKSTFKITEINEENSNFNSLLYEKKKILIKDEDYNHLVNLVNKNNFQIKSFLMFIYGYVMHKYCGQRYIYSFYLGENEKFNEKDGLNKCVCFFPFLIDINDDDLLVDSIQQMKKYNLFLDQQQFVLNFDHLKHLELKNINNIFKFRTNFKSHSQDEKKQQIDDDDNLLFDNKRYLTEDSSIDMTFEIVEEQNQYEIVLSYNSIKFDDNMMKNILECYLETIKSFGMNNNIKVGEMEFIPEEEKQKLLYQFNNNKCSYNPGKFYSSEFSRISKSIPNETAVIFENKKITYEELDQMSNSLAHYLRKFGVKRNDVVPIICERTYLYIVAFLSVMKAGGIFVYINPKFPKERIEYMINDVKPKIILKYYHEGTTDLEEFKKMNITLYDLDKHDYHHNKESINNINESSDICYIFYTSGTTGNPKGVLVSHDNLLHYCLYSQTRNGNKSVYDREYKNVLVYTQFTFAMVIVEIYYSLLQGKTLIFSNEKEFNNPQLLSDIISKWNVEFIESTPSRLDNYISNDNFRKALLNVKIICVAGESISVNFIKNLKKNSKADIYVCFGLTEATAHAACGRIKDEDIINDRITTGNTTCNYQIYILDKFLKPVPVGVIGEIYIAGNSIAKGYFKREDLTNERFINHDISEDLKQVKLYKTGDKGKWTKEGRIIHLGRVDFQLKIRGQRVEALEIENKIKEYDNIDNCIVISKKDDRNNEDHLLCYYTCSDEKDIVEEDLKNFLLEKIPSYMVPSFYIRLEEFPLSANGKLNRRALPEIDISKMAKKNYVMPETETETVVCNIIQKIFNLEEKEVGKKSNLFEIGVNSLNAFRFISKIKSVYNIKIGIKDLIKHPVVDEISLYIDNMRSDNKNKDDIDMIKKGQYKYFPITSQQLGIYIDFKKYPDATTYNTPVILRLKNDTNVDTLEKSIQYVFNDNLILKTKYLNYNDLEKIKDIDLTKQTSTNNENEMTIENLENKIYGVIDEKAELKIEHFSSDKIKSFVRPFNLEEAPLIRVAVVDNSLLIIDIHHVIIDATTISVLLEQINERYYGTKKEMTGDEIQYSDYAWFINKKVETKEYNEKFKFYEDMFSTMEYETPEIPVKNNNIEYNKNELKGQVSSYQKLIEEDVNEKINNYIEENNLSKTSFFFSVYVYVLSKYANQTNVYTSVLSKNRSRSECEKMIGMFVTTQPLLINVPSNASFNKFINDNKKTLLKVYDNEFESLAGLTEKLKLKKLNNCFAYQPENIFTSKNENNIFKLNDNNRIYSLYNDSSDGNDYSFSNFSVFDISFSIIESKSNHLISLEYNSGIYDCNTIEKFVKSFEEVIRDMDNFGNHVNTIEYIPMDEKNKILYKFNDNKYEYEKIKCYHTEFERLAHENPDKIALVFNEKEISYRELDEMSNSLAHYLRMKGVTRNDIIPIICERSYLYVVGTLAIMKSGGAFLPIDPEFPIDRIIFMINESSSKIVLTYLEDNEIMHKLKENQFQLYSLSDHDFTKNIQNIENINESSDLSYVMFTSGTTGKPKGTMLTHDNLITHCIYAQTINGHSDLYGDDVDCIISISKFTFDMSISDIYYALLRNSKVVLCNKHEYNNPIEISRLIEKYDVKFIYCVPSRFKNYLALNEFLKSLKHIKCILFGGEKIDMDTLKILQKHTNIKVYNGYGPTETVAMCSANCIDLNSIDLDSDKSVVKSIGKTLCNYQVYILDKYMKPVPIGVEGEIYIGGAGVGKGYLNNVELTNNKFVESPFKPLSKYSNSNKIYSTGDLGKWTEDGQIIYIGRSDFQVKINGQRIELSEIENTITLYPLIDYAIVINKKHSKTNSDILICYYKSKMNVLISELDLKQFILKKLPKFMCPSYFMKIEKIPLSPSGKINTKELPVINVMEMNVINYVPAETETEKEICSILQYLFKMNENEVGRTTDFIELGINSLNSIKFSYMIERRMNIKLEIKDILSHSIVQEISEYIDEVMNSNVDNSKNEIIK
ncbi:hypothetical protein PIROE2DRAFT_3971, partial [Piromyces sp. E2]